MTKAKSKLIGICILLLFLNGCKPNYDDWSIHSNNSWVTIVDNSCYSLNVSYPPIESFCISRNMSFFKGTLFDDAGCIDKQGEYHYFKIIFNRTLDRWFIGNESYSPEWSCK